MAKKSAADSARAPDLSAETAEQVFGWRNVHRHEGKLVGRKQDRLGRWRSASVPDYSNDPAQAYAIDARMKELGRWDSYIKALDRLAKSESLPREWATPAQKSRAAIRAMRGKRR